MRQFFPTEEYLYQIDQAFASKSKRDVYIIYAMIVGVLIFISYFFLWEDAEQAYVKAQAQSKAVEKKIAVDETYLQAHPESMIVKLDNDTKQYEADFLRYQESNAYIKHSIEQISELYYNEEKWGDYINSIAINALKYNVHMQELTNTFAPSQQAFGHVLNIYVKSDGNFHNTMKFINALEQSFLVVDIHGLSLQSKEQLQADLNISVWGIMY